MGLYILERGLGFWQLTFEGQEAVVRHEQGLVYVAYLLTHPEESPIHGALLSAKADSRRSPTVVTGSHLVPVGGAGGVAAEAKVQERNLGLDERERALGWLERCRELRAIVENEAEAEVVRAEALAELEAIRDAWPTRGRRLEDAAQRAVRSVRRAMVRLHAHLAGARDAAGRPHPLLTRFARHLDSCVLIPSGRYSSRRALRGREGLHGSFSYEPPPGVRWKRS